MAQDRSELLKKLEVVKKGDLVMIVTDIFPGDYVIGDVDTVPKRKLADEELPTIKLSDSIKLGAPVNFKAKEHPNFGHCGLSFNYVREIYIGQEEIFDTLQANRIFTVYANYLKEKLN